MMNLDTDFDGVSEKSDVIVLISPVGMWSLNTLRQPSACVASVCVNTTECQLVNHMWNKISLAPVVTVTRAHLQDAR